MNDRSDVATDICVSIIIINWHSKDYLRQCLRSISHHAVSVSYEIVVADAGSFDGCGEMLRDEFPEVRFLQIRENHGFARSNNLAFDVSVGSAILFLNPDTNLHGPAIDVLVAQLERLPAAGVLGARLLNTDGTLQTSCVQPLPTVVNQLLDSSALRSRWPEARLWGGATLHSESNEPQEVQAVSGACLIVKRSVFEQVGRFSEDYFMYAEDMDLAHKVRKAGYANYHVPSALVTHYGGTSSSSAASQFSAVMQREALWRFFRKFRGPIYATSYRIAMLASGACRVVVLAMMLCAYGAGPARIAVRKSLKKWCAIVGWSLGHREVVKRFYPDSLGQAKADRA